MEQNKNALALDLVPGLSKDESAARKTFVR